MDSSNHKDFKSSKKSLNIYDVTRPEWPKIMIGMSALLVNSITNLTFPWLMGSALDEIEQNKINQLLIKSSGIFLIGSVASWIRIYCIGTACSSISNRLRELLFVSYMNKEIDFFENNKQGELIEVLDKDIDETAEMFTEKLARGFRSLNSSINGSILLYVTSPKLCFVSLSIVPLVGIGAMTLSKYSRSIEKKFREVHSNLISFCLERFSSISTVRLNNRESFEKEKFSNQISNSKSISTLKFYSEGRFLSFINLTTNAALIAVLRAGGYLIQQGEITAGSLVRFAIQVR